MDVMLRRRRLMGMQEKKELYPIGTDVITKYYGRDSNGFFIGEKNVAINSDGEWATGDYYGNSTFIPINPKYRYQKSSNRMYRVTFYNAKYEPVSIPTDYNNLTVMEIGNIPSDARYMRFVSHNTANANWRLTLTRIA